MKATYVLVLTQVLPWSLRFSLRLFRQPFSPLMQHAVTMVALAILLSPIVMDTTAL